MKLIIILIILCFILLYVYNINIDTFSIGNTTPSSIGNTTPSSIGNNGKAQTTNRWFDDDTIEINKPKIDKNNIKLSWLKPMSLNVIEYYIVLEKQDSDNTTINKQIFMYTNNNTVINYYIGNLDNGKYKIYLYYKVEVGEPKKKTYKELKTTEVEFVIDYNNTILYNENENENTSNTVETQYTIIKDTLSDFNPINDNYNINIY